ncbi:TadE/TadG family type IV pilus assembly protein [Zhongshania aliphaticivorans]|uniref:TadE/TadG family type IV pilus assembly protein n=1 Tax=Zhongshania aliphaticivorans TaxID=1470434 RepID=UPI0012E49E98|nr:TadE/TadG family type IV pilus assembly protein [Zhongshania aliphaticivorans]CAA0107880.1 Uncharacterised protein [Zhongshania aliphaticivorans]
MINRNFYRPLQRRQRGVVAIEFVIIFPVLFTICYAVIAYSLAFLLIQNMTYTSEELLRKAIGSEYEICDEPSETGQTPQEIAECKIIETYKEFASGLLLISPASYYSTNIGFCESNLICELEIRADPLTSVSIFGFKLLNLSDDKLVGRASLLF